MERGSVRRRCIFCQVSFFTGVERGTGQEIHFFYKKLKKAEDIDADAALECLADRNKGGEWYRKGIRIGHRHGHKYRRIFFVSAAAI